MVRGEPSVLSTNPRSRAKVDVWREGAATIIGVASRDYPGLAASITGTLWSHNIAIQRAALFSASSYRLVLDFFHLAPRATGSVVVDTQSIEDAIVRLLYIGDNEAVPDVVEFPTLEGWNTEGSYRLRAKTSGTVGELIYALTYKLYHKLDANIYSLIAETGRGGAWVSVFHDLPPSKSLEAAREIVRASF